MKSIIKILVLSIGLTIGGLCYNSLKREAVKDYKQIVAFLAKNTMGQTLVLSN